MPEDSLISELLTILRVVAVLGFIATGALVLGLSYRGFVKLYGEKIKEAKYRWIFAGICVLVVLSLMFIYLVLF